MAHYPLPSPNPWRPYWSSVPTITGVRHQNTATIKMHLQAPGSQAATLKQSCKATSWHDSGMYTSNRKHEPGHYMLTIKSFSLLSEARTTKIISDVFEASGHKWRLDLYPNGDQAENEYSHISLYLILCGTESLSNGEEVCVDVNFFVYDHIAQTYVILQDFKGNKIMFGKKNTKWGFDKLILLDSFKESGNGYLCNDSCVIGVEIFKVPKYTQKDQCLSLIKPPPTMNTHTWTIDKFSRVTEKVMYSDVFKVGKVNWRIALYPKGDDKNGKNMSMFLCVHDTASFPKSWRLCAISKLRVKNQIGNVDREIEGEDWFCDSHDRSGLKDFMPLSELYDSANGFLLNRVLIVEAEILVSTEDGHDLVFKLLLIGDSSVGKSCLLSRFTRGEFTLDPKPTTTNNSAARHVYVDNNIIEAQIVDIAGNHKYRDFTTDVQMQDVVGALIVYDVTRHSTFEDVERWYMEFQIANFEIEVILIGNTSDLVKDSVTSFTDVGKTFADKVSLSFIETSAKNTTNVEKAFAELVTRIFRKEAGTPTVSPTISSEDEKIMTFSYTLDTQLHWLVTSNRINVFSYGTATTFRSSGKNEPAHYMLKIESFSLLSEAETSKLESDIFEASGYKWRLELYPNGNKKDNTENHISVYLAICDTESLPKGWEVYVDAKFCIFDHVRHNYITFQDVDRKKERFHEKKMKWGFNELLSLDYFNDAGNGWLFHDSCVFGAEVFGVSKYAEKDQCLSMIRPPTVMNTHTWTIEKFSAITEDVLNSDYFKVGKVKWKLKLYPKGNAAGKDTYLSIFLHVHVSGLLPNGWRVYVKYKIRVKNQCGFADTEGESEQWYQSHYGWGYPCFMLLSELSEPEKGFLLNDVLIVEA